MLKTVITAVTINLNRLCPLLVKRKSLYFSKTCESVWKIFCEKKDKIFIWKHNFLFCLTYHLVYLLIVIFFSLILKILYYQKCSTFNINNTNGNITVFSNKFDTRNRQTVVKCAREIKLRDNVNKAEVRGNIESELDSLEDMKFRVCSESFSCLLIIDVSLMSWGFIYLKPWARTLACAAVPEMIELSVLCTTGFGSWHFKRHPDSQWSKSIAEQAPSTLSGLQKVA